MTIIKTYILVYIHNNSFKSDSTQKDGTIM